MFKTLRLFFGLFLFSRFIVDGDGAGGDSYYDDIDIDDNDGGEPTPTVTSKDDKQTTTPTVATPDPSKKIEELETKLKEQEEFISQQKNQTAITEAISDIKTRMADFDEKAVYEHLKKMNETDPKKAQAYNNPIGWENIWNQIKPVAPSNDRFTRGRNTEPVNRDDEVFSLVKSGGATLADEADVVAKYL